MKPLMIIVLLSYPVLCGAAMLKSFWESESNQDIVSYDTTSQGLSILDCVLQCATRADCAKATFASVSGLCYFQPSVVTPSLPSTALGEGQNLFSVNTVEGCDVGSAPSVSNSAVDEWRRTAARVEGAAVCSDDHTASDAGAPLLSCKAAEGLWRTQGGTCNRKIWRDDSVILGQQYKLPRTPDVGWTVCFNASITSNFDRFQVNLQTSGGEQPLHMSGRMHWNQWIKVTVLDWLIGGSYSSDAAYLLDPSPPFPFHLGHQFFMCIVASDLREFEVYVNGSLYGSSVFPGPHTVTSVDNIAFLDNIQVHYLDLWYPGN